MICFRYSLTLLQFFLYTNYKSYECFFFFTRTGRLSQPTHSKGRGSCLFFLELNLGHFEVVVVYFNPWITGIPFVVDLVHENEFHVMRFLGFLLKLDLVNFISYWVSLVHVSPQRGMRITDRETSPRCYALI